MSTVAGVFSETLLRTLRAKADELMFDDRIKQQFVPQIGILDAIAAVQTAQITPQDAFLNHFRRWVKEI